METNETSYKTFLKNTIIKFLCYGILIGFIFLLVIFFAKHTLFNTPNLALSIVLSLICGIMIGILLRFICKSSIIESFQKDKLDSENAKLFLQKMNWFFIACAVFSIIVCLGYLVLDNFIFTSAIDNAYEQYDFISSEFANRVVINILNTYNKTFLSKVLNTFIIQISLVISFFSLMPYSEKLLKKYN